MEVYFRRNVKEGFVWVLFGLCSWDIDICTSLANYVHIGKDFPPCFCDVNQFIDVLQTIKHAFLFLRFKGFFFFTFSSDKVQIESLAVFAITHCSKAILFNYSLQLTRNQKLNEEKGTCCLSFVKSCIQLKVRVFYCGLIYSGARCKSTLDLLNGNFPSPVKDNYFAWDKFIKLASLFSCALNCFCLPKERHSLAQLFFLSMFEFIYKA